MLICVSLCLIMCVFASVSVCLCVYSLELLVNQVMVLGLVFFVLEFWIWY